MSKHWKIVGINFDHFHMGDLLRLVYEHPSAEIAGVCDDDPERLCPELDEILPDSANLPYDMRKVIESVVDDGEFMEYFPHWAMSMLCGFSRIDGRTVGIGRTV